MRQLRSKIRFRGPFSPGSGSFRTPSILGRHPSCLHLLPGALVFTIYLSTLAPTVTGEDSGELITAAYHFGVPHPPGYPLWTILCGIWTNVIPFGGIGWRANLLSAVTMALCVAVLAATLIRLKFRPAAACSAAAIFGLTSTVWSQSVIAEVYALNMLLVVVLLWCLVRWHQSRDRRWLVWASLVLGLGMSNHHIIGLAALGLGLWVISQDIGLLKNTRWIARCLMAFAVGLTPYMYLLWAARRNAPVNWGETTTLAALWEHVSRGQYKSDNSIDARVPFTLGAYIGKLYYAIRWEVRQFTPVLIPLITAGMIWLWRRRRFRAIFKLVVITSVTCGPLFHYLSGPQLDRQDEFVNKVFVMPLALISAIPLAAGLQWAMAATRKSFLGSRRINRQSMAWIGSSLLVLIPLLTHLRENNMRHYWYAFDHAKNMLACMLPSALVFPSGDHNTFPLIYLIHVEGIRPDVVVADKYGYIEPQLYHDMPGNPGKPRTLEHREAIEAWVIGHSKRPVYFTIKKTPRMEETDIVPVGLLYHLNPKGRTVDTEGCWDRIRYRNLERNPAPEDHAAMNIVADYYYARGVYALERGEIDKAREAFGKTLEHAWGIKEIFNNVGSALADYGLIDESISRYEEAARLDWRYAPARWNLAKIFQANGKVEWAARVYQDLVSAVPGDFRPYGELGFIYANVFHDSGRAQHWWYESLRRNPMQPQIIEALATIGSTARDIQQVNPSSKSEETGLVVEPAQANLGRITDSGQKTIEVAIRNKGTQAVAVKAIQSSCSCVMHDMVPFELDPGQTERRRIGLRGVGKHGMVHETIQLMGQDDQELASIRIQAEVIQQVIATPASIVFRTLPGERPAPATLTLEHHDGVAFRVTNVRSTLVHARPRWSSDLKSSRHEITVEALESGTGPEYGQLVVETNLPESPNFEVPVSIEARIPAVAMPGMVYFGLLTADEVAKRDVWLTSVNEGQPIEPRVAADALPTGMDAQVIQASADGSHWRLQIEIDARKALKGVLRHELEVQFAGSPVPLEVSIHGMVGQ